MKTFYCSFNNYVGFTAVHFTIFHKLEVPTVILRCLISLNLKLQKTLTTVFFNFGRKKTENLSFKNGHFVTICGHVFGNYIYRYLSQN